MKVEWCKGLKNMEKGVILKKFAGFSEEITHLT
jgi:hypothetical protein